MDANTQDIRKRRTEIRNVNRIAEVLEFAAKKGVTLVQLEAMAYSWLPRNEEIAEGVKQNRKRINHHVRAINANRARWRKAKLFLEGHTTQKEKVKTQIAAVGSMLDSLEGPPQPKTEPELIPLKQELF